MIYRRFTRTVMTLGFVTNLIILGAFSPEEAVAQTVLTVDCNDPGQTLNVAIQAANPGDTIQVSGTCEEMVTITKDRLTIDGQGGAIIDGGGGFPVESVISGVVTIDAASGVHLSGLTVQNGADGVLIVRGASARLTDVTSQGNADEGLQVHQGSTATFSGNILSQNNSDDGIGVYDASSLRVSSGSSVRSLNNGDDGISVFASSVLRVQSSTLQTDNNGQRDEFGDGLQITGTSTVRLGGTTTITADHNTYRGILLSNASYLLVSDTSVAIVTNNDRDGLGIFNLSRFSLGSGTSLRSESNARTGIVVSSIAIAFCSNESTVTLLNNVSAPSSVSGNSQASQACLGLTTMSQMKAQSLAAPMSSVDDQESN